MFFAREGIGFKLGAPIAGGEEGREVFTRTPGGFYKELDVIFLSFEGVVKRAVITKNYQ